MDISIVKSILHQFLLRITEFAMHGIDKEKSKIPTVLLLLLVWMIASSLALIFTHSLYPPLLTTCYILSRASQECSGVIHPSSMKSVIFLPLSPRFPSSSYCIASRMCYEEEIWLFYRIGCNWVGFVLLLFNSSYVLTRKSFTCSL